MFLRPAFLRAVQSPERHPPHCFRQMFRQGLLCCCRRDCSEGSSVSGPRVAFSVSISLKRTGWAAGGAAASSTRLQVPEEEEVLEATSLLWGLLPAAASCRCSARRSGHWNAGRGLGSAVQLCEVSGMGGRALEPGRLCGTAQRRERPAGLRTPSGSSAAASKRVGLLRPLSPTATCCRETKRARWRAP